MYVLTMLVRTLCAQWPDKARLNAFVSKQGPQQGSRPYTNTAPAVSEFDGQTHCGCCNYFCALGDAAGASSIILSRCRRGRCRRPLFLKISSAVQRPHHPDPRELAAPCDGQFGFTLAAIAQKRARATASTSGKVQTLIQFDLQHDIAMKPDFTIGDRVQMTALGASRCIRLADRMGTIVGRSIYANSGSQSQRHPLGRRKPKRDQQGFRSASHRVGSVQNSRLAKLGLRR